MIFLIFDFLLIWCSTFSSLTLPSVVMITFYILSKRFFMNSIIPQELSDARVASVTKKEYGFAVYFYRDI